MALAKKCDRCGKLYEHYLYGETKRNLKFNALTMINANDYGDLCGINKTVDLCPECMTEFESWFNAKE